MVVVAFNAAQPFHILCIAYKRYLQQTSHIDVEYCSDMDNRNGWIQPNNQR